MQILISPQRPTRAKYRTITWYADDRVLNHTTLARLFKGYVLDCKDEWNEPLSRRERYYAANPKKLSIFCNNYGGTMTVLVDDVDRFRFEIEELDPAPRLQTRFAGGPSDETGWVGRGPQFADPTAFDGVGKVDMGYLWCNNGGWGGFWDWYGKIAGTGYEISGTCKLDLRAARDAAVAGLNVKEKWLALPIETRQKHRESWIHWMEGN